MVVMNKSSMAARTAGKISGSEIRRSVLRVPAPVITEASSSRGSMAWKAAEMSR